MVEKIFWQDPYLTQLETEVACVQANEITLKETIFFAFSGGQESDGGTIGNYPVFQARKEGQEIFYTLEEDHTLQPKERVEVKIDWTRRYRLMRLHFAAEIVLELVCDHLKSIQKIGAHIAQDKARIDFEWEGNISQIFPLLQEKSTELVQADLEIISAFSDREAGKRYWEIDGFARVPCGGTHLKKTSEIGTIRMKRKNPGKGKERIEIYVDDPS